MPGYVRTDWYDHPLYYDIVFAPDTAREVDFLLALWARHGRTTLPPRHRPCALELACGTGRTVLELARRDWRSRGFDLNPHMLVRARAAIASAPPRIQKLATVRRARMEAFREPPASVDLAHCLLSTFKYLLTERDARACLRSVERALRPGGIFVLGLHLARPQRRTIDREIWHGQEGAISVRCVTETWPLDPRTRRERLRNRLDVVQPGPEGRPTQLRLETRWQCRTYTADQLRTTLAAAAPALHVVACHDFHHRLDRVRAFDDAQEDLVLVLRKHPA